MLAQWKALQEKRGMEGASMLLWCKNFLRSWFGQGEIGSGESMSRNRRGKLKKAKATVAQTDKVHDRVSRDIPDAAVAAEIEIVDPYGDKTDVAVNLRDDPLRGMLCREQIDQAQFMAGRLWQHYHERATIGGVAAMDMAKDDVDGGKIPEPITDSQIDAIRKLNEARKALGSYDTNLVYEVLHSRKKLSDLAVEWAMGSEREKLYLGRRFKDALETLANLWGMTTRRKRFAA